MRRGGGPPQAVVTSVPTTLGLPFPQCANEVLAKLSKHVRLCGSKHRAAIAQSAEYQQLIDNDVFCLTQDQWRIPKLNPFQQFLLLDVFKRFFVDKAEDPNRNTYFDLIFLGRDGDKHVHEHRISVLMDFASFALQTPIPQVYIMISQWLSKANTPKSHAEKLISQLVEHFIKPDWSTGLHNFLLPLDAKCPEFTGFFVVYAHRFSPVNITLATVLGSYISVNINYLLCQFRDCSYMANEFAKEVFPKCLWYVLTIESQPSCWGDWNSFSAEEKEKLKAVSTLACGLSQLLQRWHTKVKGNDLNYEPVFEKGVPWTTRRREFLSTIAAISPSHRTDVEKNMDSMNVPKHFLEEVNDILQRIAISV